MIQAQRDRLARAEDLQEKLRLTQWDLAVVGGNQQEPRLGPVAVQGRRVGSVAVMVAYAHNGKRLSKGGVGPEMRSAAGLEPTPDASDLNPVAVTISKAMIEIPPRFAGRAPVGSEGVSPSKFTNKTSSLPFEGGIKSIHEVLLSTVSATLGFASQAAVQSQAISQNKVVSSDPPYYDNIGYADLSDFFYVWIRSNAKQIFPGLFATVAVPKAEELVATPYRHGGKEQAEKFFLDGMTEALRNLAQQAHPAFPVTIYCAFKQSETTSESGTSSTGWETFLEAVLKAGFALTGTWPMRTELERRILGSGTNALASSILLVCRQRPADAPTVSRREFIRELNAALPEALDEMTRGGVNSPVAPVDLSQAIIGPGMAIFSQYAAVLEADGTPMRMRTALQLINRFLAEDDFDHDTQFCLHWFEQQGWATGKYGDADVLARAKVMDAANRSDEENSR
jgi:adenine-specific DNA methylase